MNVHILVTARQRELLSFSLLVFKTIRIGFPTSTILVSGNDLPEFALEDVKSACTDKGCEFTNISETIHHKYIESLVGIEKEPFVICDTDIIFYESVEGWKFDTALAGYRIPEFFDEFSNAITRSRLHTSLLYIDPVKVRAGIEAFSKSRPETPFTPTVNLFNPLVLPFNSRNYFYDTCSMLFQAIGGTAFTARQKDAFFHFHFGSISDVVLPRLSNGVEMESARQAVLENTAKGYGAWRWQDAYYESRQFVEQGKPVIAPIDDKDAAEARRWNVELCLGNQDAMQTNDVWYQLCHGLDDLLDTMQDGRPVMSKAQIISVFLKALFFYNSKFYLENQPLLFPIALQITNSYMDSVEWENSPKKHLRAMGDVFRTCGNEMYVMVAARCGGEDHMRKMSMLIKERDWLGQHTENGEPK